MEEATRVFTEAVTDNSMAAEEQAEFDARLKKEQQDKDGAAPAEDALTLTESENHATNMTIEEGMERTGGYVGTDMDPNDPIQL